MTAVQLTVDGSSRSPDEASRLRAELAIDAARIGTFDWDLVSGRLTWDARLIEMFGYGPTTSDAGTAVLEPGSAVLEPGSAVLEPGSAVLDPHSAPFDETITGFQARVHPDDLPRVTDALQTAIAGCADYEAEYRIVLPSGDVRWITARGRALSDETGGAVRVVGVAFDVTAERAGDARVTRLLEAMPAGFVSVDRQGRFTYVNAEAERLLGRSREDLLGQFLASAFPAVASSPFDDGFRRAIDTGAAVSFEAFYPDPLNGWYELRAWPTTEGLSISFLDVTDRREAQQRAERATARMALLSQVSGELAGSMDARKDLAALPPLVVPALADWCIVSVLEGNVPRDVGSWHADPALRPLVQRYSQLRLLTLASGRPAVWSVSSSQQVPTSGRDALAALAPGEALDLLRRLAPEHLVALPMRGRGRTLGLLTLYWDAGHTRDEEDLATAQDIADRAGLALDNARLQAQQQQLAEELQRSMLTDPPEPDHAEIAVRYVPAVEAAQVGGDWYDAFLQPDGATMLVIGDVAGHDMAAAAAMGQLRSLLRGIATYSNAGPAEVLRGLDAAMQVLQVRTLATAAVARFEQDDDDRARGVTHMVWANAGHLPPLAVTPDGAVTVLGSATADLLLGVDPSTVRREWRVTLDRETTVVLVTDGLVERRDADLDAGLLRLRTALGELADRPLPELCDELLARLVDGRPEDDVALVAVRLHRQDRPRPPEVGPGVVPDGVPRER